MKLRINATDVARAISKKLEIYKQAGEILLDKKEDLLDRIITYDIDNGEIKQYVNGEEAPWTNYTYTTGETGISTAANTETFQITAKFGDKPSKQELVQAYKSILDQLAFIREEMAVLTSVFRNCIEIDGSVEVDSEELAKYGL